jgi:CRP/FNR family cyclic AMP-dependent transcriptional regulator
MTPLETSLARAGLEPTGTGLKLSAFGPHWLHDSPLLEDFTLDEADIVGAGMFGARALAGQVLVVEGQVGDWMLLLLSGTVDVTRRIGEGDEVARLAVIRAGAAVGEMSMLDGEPRYATCTAIDAVEFAVLTRQAVARADPRTSRPWEPSFWSRSPSCWPSACAIPRSNSRACWIAELSRALPGAARTGPCDESKLGAREIDPRQTGKRAKRVALA